MYHRALCPLFSPAAYAFTSLHYLKHKGPSRHLLSSPPFSSLSLSLLFSLLCLPFICSADLFTFLSFHICSLLSTSCFIFSSHAYMYSLCHVPSYVSPGLFLFSSLNSPLFLSSLISPPTLPSSSFSPPPSLPLLSPFSVHPLMIAEHISLDIKTKGWVHMWFLGESCVIWNINAGIIWLPGWGGGGGGGSIITSDCRFLPQMMVRLSGWIEEQ